MPDTNSETPDWEGSGRPQPKAEALRTSSKSADEKPYVHVPGTTHLNAFLEDVEAAKAKVSEAKTELVAAEERLHQKKVESGMI